MNHFSSHLRGIATRLSIPEPSRSRVLLEISTDMEDLFQHLLATGMAAEEAAGQVTEQFDLSDEALRELTQVHNTPIGRSLDGLSGQARSTWERVILGLVALFVAPSLGGFLFQPALLRDASPLVIALLGITLLSLIMGLAKAVAFFRPGPVRAPVPRRGVRALPALSLLLLLLGFAGIWIELYRSALSIREEPGNALRSLVEWLQMASATMVVSLSGALLIALFWFFLENRASHLEEKAASGILESRR